MPSGSNVETAKHFLPNIPAIFCIVSIVKFSDPLRIFVTYGLEHLPR